MLILVALASCRKAPKGLVRVTPNNSKTVEINRNYLEPIQEEQNDFEQRIIDRYYEEMVSLYPQFGTIPREMLKEYYYKTIDGEDFRVGFIFCFGGIPTDCSCTFSTSPRHPEGEWRVEEDEFSQFYQRGLDEGTMRQIRTYLAKGITEFVDMYHLKKTDLSSENISVYWQIKDGKIYACSEHIAYTTSSTTKMFGCGDHAHVFGKVLVELTDDTVQLTAYRASGG